MSYRNRQRRRTARWVKRMVKATAPITEFMMGEFFRDSPFQRKLKTLLDYNVTKGTGYMDWSGEDK